jgi:hypothetical protein
VFWDRSILSMGYARGIFAAGSARLQLHQPLPVAEHPASLVLDLEGASLGTNLYGLSGVSGSPSPLDSRVSGQGSFVFTVERPEEIEGSFSLEGVAPTRESLPVFSTPVSFRTRAAVGEQKLEIQELQLETPFLSGTLSGVYPREGAASLSIDFTSSDLAAADAFQGELQRILAHEDDLSPDQWRVEGREGGRPAQRAPAPHGLRGELSPRLRLETMELGAMRTKALVPRDAVTFQISSPASRVGLSLVTALCLYLGPFAKGISIRTPISLAGPLLGGLPTMPRDLAGSFTASVVRTAPGGGAIRATEDA